MTIRFLLDTNVLSEPLRLRPDARVMDHLRTHATEIAIAGIVLHELRYGACRLPPGPKRATLERFLDEVVGKSVPVLPYDGDAAQWHADERARLKSIGLHRPFVDGQIAAIARTQRLTLVTNHVAHYEGFAELVVERWHTRARVSGRAAPPG